MDARRFLVSDNGVAEECVLFMHSFIHLFLLSCFPEPKLDINIAILFAINYKHLFSTVEVPNKAI